MLGLQHLELPQAVQETGKTSIKGRLGAIRLSAHATWFLCFIAGSALDLFSMNADPVAETF